MKETDIVHVERNAEETQEFTIKPKYQIGTELWFMENNTPRLALIAQITVLISSFDDRDKNSKGWLCQLFERWIQRRAKSYWNYRYNYVAKVDGYNTWFSIEIGEGKEERLFILNRRCYFSKQQLLNSLK